MMNRDELKAAINKCVKCGRCLGSCPIYKLTGWEGSVSRGKIALLKADLEGEVDLHGRMKDLLSHCLLCGACAEGCASGVKGDEIIQAGRALAIGDGGLAKFKSLALRDLLARGLGAQMLWKSRRLFLKDVPPESGLHFRFPAPGLDKRRWLPPLAEKSFLEDLPPLKTRGRAPGWVCFSGAWPIISGPNPPGMRSDCWRPRVQEWSFPKPRSVAASRPREPATSQAPNTWPGAI